MIKIKDNKECKEEEIMEAIKIMKLESALSALQERQ